MSDIEERILRMLHAFPDAERKIEVRKIAAAVRDLERENERLTKANIQLREGAEEQKQCIKRLLKTGDYLCAAAAFMGWHDKIEDWNKATEAKP